MATAKFQGDNRKPPVRQYAGKRRKPPKPKDERTKFDKWLERMRQDRSRVEICFASEVSSEYPSLSQVVHIIDVDRYMLLVEMKNGEVMWVSKSLITSAMISEDELEITLARKITSQRGN
jgi:hypothetical protein